MDMVIDVLYFISIFLEKGSHSTRAIADTARVVNEDYKCLKASLDEVKTKNRVQKLDFEN